MSWSEMQKTSIDIMDKLSHQWFSILRIVSCSSTVFYTRFQLRTLDVLKRVLQGAGNVINQRGGKLISSNRRELPNIFAPGDNIHRYQLILGGHEYIIFWPKLLQN